MSFLDEVRTKRQKLADVLSDEDYSGIREIVEDLYPDKAHFIYELLQNAEDTRATEASFTLDESSLSFEHNDRPFDENDVWGITNIGKGTKRDQEDKIGRFGVGFKAVFVYSETPFIWSPTFSFKISELVLPTEIVAKPTSGQRTRFEFPFNNPKKPGKVAFEEVRGGLEELAETTLLFLSNLETIRWQVGQTVSGEVLRVMHSENHVEVLKSTGNTTTASSHFLRFSNSVLGLPKQSISVAFELDFLPNVTAFDPTASLSKQLKIASAEPGRVSVFFPAEKETSGLRFHLHAPFVPELSRASIKETDANKPLFEQLAQLAAASLHTIRDLGLLSGDFLGVLPNPQDVIPSRYQLIRAAIIEEMNNKPLTPTHTRSHAPAKHLLQAKASLKDLLSEADTEFLVEYEDEPPQWTIGALQRSNNDKFLSGLAITDWDIDTFVETLVDKASFKHRNSPNPPYYWRGLDDAFMNWLATHPVDWHQQMYALLYRELDSAHELQKLKSLQLEWTQIVRLSDGSYSKGDKCYFPSDGVLHDEILPRVDRGIYTSGKSKTQQEEARKLLEFLGVREVGEAEEVQAILKKKYTKGLLQADRKDLKRFVALVEKEPETAEMFSSYSIFNLKGADGENENIWGRPSRVFLDLPYLETGLRAYYDALGESAERHSLSDSYQKGPISKERLLKFAVAVGVIDKLPIIETNCNSNPARKKLYSAQGGWSDTYGINKDYMIKNIESLFKNPNEAISRLVWKTLCQNTGQKYLVARYRNNSHHEENTAASQLVCILKNARWIPQKDGEFVCPAEASQTQLPKGFPFDDGYVWLKEIGFGEKERLLSLTHQVRQDSAKAAGFADAEALARGQKFAELLPKEKQERILADEQRRQAFELPDHESRNPDLRAERVAQQAANAPERISEMRTRSVSVGRDEIKQEADPYLREQYTDPNGDMICQICKAPLPFKLDDGSYYLEKVEFLNGLRKHYHQNYLALCPNHSAMFQHVNGSRELMRDMFLEIVGNELEIVLAQENSHIYFTKTHIADLRKVIEVDGVSD